MQATRIRPDTRPTDRPPPRRGRPVGPDPGTRSAVQRPAPAGGPVPHPVARSCSPSALLIVGSQSPARLAAWVVSPPGPRHAADAQRRAPRVAAGRRRPGVPRHAPDRADRPARDRRHRRHRDPRGRCPHLVVYRYGTVLGDTFDRIFTGAVLGAVDDRAAPAPARSRARASGSTSCSSASTSAASGPTNLTDTMMVASLDPVGHTVSHRLDPARPDRHPARQRRRRTGPKLNSLMRYADTPPEGVPAGRHARRSRTRSARCSASRSTTTRSSTSPASSRWSMRSAASTSTSPSGVRRPDYDGFGVRRARATRSRPATHHLDGANALAYARSRKGAGESDFTRQAASSRSSSPCATRRHARRQPAVRAARPARRGRRHGPHRPAGRAGCPSSRRSWRRSAATT